MKNLGNKVFRSSLWMLSAQLSERLFGIISIAILARILVPEDYGIAAMTQVVIMFFQIILSDGSELYLIRKDKISNKDLNTAWTARIILFSIASALLFLGRGLISDYMEEQRLNEVLMFSALSTMVLGFKNIGIVKYRRNFNYKRIFKIHFLTKLFSFIVTIVIAIIYENYWALIIGTLSLNLFYTIFSFLFCSYRPGFTLIKFQQQWAFSKWHLTSNFTSFIRNHSMYFIIPKFFGTAALGSYTMAYHLALMFYEQIIIAISEPVFASYTSVKHNKYEFSSLIIKVFSIITIMLMPAYLSLYILSEEIILFFLGENWVHTKTIFGILLLFVFFQAYINTIDGILISKGYVKYLAILNWILATVLLAILIISAYNFSLEIIVLSRTLIALLYLAIFIYSLNKRVWIDVRLLFLALLRHTAATIIMALLLIVLLDLFSYLPFWILLIPLIIISVLIYSLATIIFWILAKRPDGGEKFILDKILLVVVNFKILKFSEPFICRILK